MRRRIRMGNGRELDSLLSSLSLLFFSLSRSNSERERDKLPYPRSLDIRNAFIDGSLRSLLNCRANVSSSERVYPRGRAVSIYPGNFVFPTCGTAELADSSRVQFKLYPRSDFPLPVPLQHVSNSLSLFRTISFFIRIFSSLRLKKKIER